MAEATSHINLIPNKDCLDFSFQNVAIYVLVDNISPIEVNMNTIEEESEFSFGLRSKTTSSADLFHF